MKWSYSNKILSPEISSEETLRTPTVAQWLDGVALRDLKLHQKHAACIDARGDVYQWGEGFFGESLKAVRSPKLTLRGKVRPSASASRGWRTKAKRYSRILSNSNSRTRSFLHYRHLERCIHLLRTYSNKTFVWGLQLLPVTRGGVLDGFGVKTKSWTSQS